MIIYLSNTTSTTCRLWKGFSSDVVCQYPSIAHVQLADNPGRHEPGTGEINYPFLINHIDELGYDGWIGCEYKPQATTSEGLDWINLYR